MCYVEDRGQKNMHIKNKQKSFFKKKNIVYFSIGCSLLTLLFSTQILAGGSIFGGGGKARSNNPDGVYSIGVHICNSLNCLPIVIEESRCVGKNVAQQYGVCVCEKGHENQGGECVPCPEGQDGDGITGCSSCAPGTYRKNEHDAECIPCPQ